jgi:uncharacterized cupredoxin-like copper-binding protein
MNRSRLTSVSIALGVCLVGGMFAAFSAFASTSTVAQRAAAKKATTITVTAGKPSELAFKLSKTSSIPAGTVIFKVKNSGVLSHTFSVCLTPTTTAANKCKGKSKTTPLIKPGKSATLTVVLSKKGKYEYLCTVPGHAASGMKGLFGIAVAVKAPIAPKPTPTTTTKPVSTTPMTTTTTAATCTNPESSTVTVSEFEWGFTLSSNSVHCGTITFVQTNTGGVQHNFDVSGIAVGALIDPGQSTTTVATFAPGTYQYQCDVEGHATLGMTGTLVVTNT